MTNSESANATPDILTCPRLLTQSIGALWSLRGVPGGPWTQLGNNNPFVQVKNTSLMAQREQLEPVLERKGRAPDQSLNVNPQKLLNTVHRFKELTPRQIRERVKTGSRLTGKSSGNQTKARARRV